MRQSEGSYGRSRRCVADANEHDQCGRDEEREHARSAFLPHHPVGGQAQAVQAQNCQSSDEPRPRGEPNPRRQQRPIPQPPARSPAPDVPGMDVARRRQHPHRTTCQCHESRGHERSQPSMRESPVTTSNEIRNDATVIITIIGTSRTPASSGKASPSAVVGVSGIHHAAETSLDWSRTTDASKPTGNDPAYRCLPIWTAPSQHRNSLPAVSSPVSSKPQTEKDDTAGDQNHYDAGNTVVAMKLLRPAPCRV